MNHLLNDTVCHNDIQNYKIYINSTCIRGSQYQQDIEEFEAKYEQENYAYSMEGFYDYLANNVKLTKDYTAHFQTYFGGLLASGIIFPATYTIHQAMLSFFFSKTNFSVNEEHTEYEENNFLVLRGKDKDDNGNILLQEIASRDCAFWLTLKGRICIRFSKTSEATEYTLKEASSLMSNFMEMDICFTDKNTPNKNDDVNYIHTRSLLLIQNEVFNTQVNKEFFQIDGLWYRNKFKPSKLLQLNQEPKQVPVNIFSLIANLVNYDSERFFIFINWLASFFQTLKKSQVAILFKGTQGSGKGTLFKIIEKLFGQIYCKQINGDSLRSNYLGSFIEDTLFLNFDEISYKTVGKGSFSGFLKAIITNDEVTSEKKGINMSKPTKVHAQTILFSNVDNPVEIEASDRRFVVFTTAGNLKESNFFGHGSFESFEDKINSEIEDFAMYLKLFHVDTRQANSVFETPEKALMVNSTENNLQWLVNAIFTNNWQYFEPLKNANIALYNIFMKQLLKYRIFQKHLILVYTTLYPQDKYISSARVLIKHLEQIAPAVFGEHNLYKTSGNKYYKLMLEDIVDEPINCATGNIFPPRIA